MAQTLLGDAFDVERKTIEAWSTCFYDSVSSVKTNCRPFVLSEGFPFRLFFVCIVYMAVFSIFIRRILGKSFANVCLGLFLPSNKKKAKNTTLRKRENKFLSSFVELVLYSSFLVHGVLLLRRQPWIFDRRQWWEFTPATNVSAHIMLFELMYAARYTAMLISLLVFEERKKDFVEMVLHHVVTISLVCLSLSYGYVRIGLVIMVLFDFADPWLHLAKLLNYMKQSFPSSRLLPLLTDGFLAAFAVTFSLTRIGLFGVVVYSVSVESYKVVALEESLFLAVQELNLAHHVCVLLVWIVFALQWFWFIILVKVVYKSVVLGEEPKDDRSDEEEEEELKQTSAEESAKKKQ